MHHKLWQSRFGPMCLVQPRSSQVRFLPSRLMQARHAAYLSAVLLTGCALGPKGTAPVMPQPAHYAVEATPVQAGGDAAVQHFALGARAVPQWWLAYRSDTLDAWVEEGLRQNYSLAQASHTLAAAREQLRAQVGASLLPSLDAAGQTSRQRALGIPQLGPQTDLYNVFGGQLDASYTFDLFGAARFANSALAAQVDAQSYQLDAVRRALAANLVTAAINAAALKAQVDATERLVALADLDSSEMQRRYQLGAASSDDVLNAQANADAVRATVPGLLTQWQATRHALAVLMGRTPDAAPPDLELAALSLPDPVPVAVPSDLLKQRPDILAADAALKGAAAQVAVATANLFPSLSITGSFGQAGFTFPSAVGAAGAVWSMGTSLSQPLFHGGALLAKRRSAQDAYQASLSNYQQTVLSAFQNVADSLTALTHDAETQEAAASERGHSAQAWHDAQRRAAAGSVAPSAVRTDEKQYQNARLSEIRAISARLTDTAALFQAMGIVPGGSAKGSGDLGFSSPTACRAPDGCR
jgi:NodT family efflux transporter outer membrane factor (OMF) lipoprotein